MAGASGVLLSVYLVTPEHWPTLVTALATVAIAWLAFESHMANREAREREQARLDSDVTILAFNIVHDVEESQWFRVRKGYEYQVGGLLRSLKLPIRELQMMAQQASRPLKLLVNEAAAHWRIADSHAEQQGEDAARDRAPAHDYQTEPELMAMLECLRMALPESSRIEDRRPAWKDGDQIRAALAVRLRTSSQSRNVTRDEAQTGEPDASSGPQTAPPLDRSLA